MLQNFLKRLNPTSTDPKQSMLHYRKVIERILVENLLHFWRTRIIDAEDGGYRINHDIEGVWLGVSNKRTFVQARALWFFSRVARSAYGTPQDVKTAEHGCAFLKSSLWDAEYGGFFWETDSTGKKPTMLNKHLYAQAMALYALSEYSMISPDHSVKEFMEQLFELMEAKFYDAEFGGYLEFFRRDWSLPPEDAPNYLRIGINNKSLNTHLHLMEAFTSYYSAAKDPRALKRIQELIVILIDTVVLKEVGACALEFCRNWTSLRSLEEERVSYGHDLETIWLHIHACKAAAIAPMTYVDVYRKLFENAVATGYDKKKGGFFQEGFVLQLPDKRQKTWWVQAEALVSCLNMYSLTKENTYLSYFEQTLEWLCQFQIDWKNGEWYERVDQYGKPEGIKAGPWKACYHSGRCVLECLNQLASMLAKEQ